jgi:hypothetical protein
MFSRLFRGRRSPPPFTTRPSDAPIRVDEARLQAWALALGHEQPPARRAHRGNLPDVDLARAVPAPRKPGPAARLMARLLRRHRPATASDPPAGGAVEAEPASFAPAGPLPVRRIEAAPERRAGLDDETMTSRDRAA